ncbi:MAG TPA: tRNA (guanosine(37)-N1)-methyltransferase TrmD [Methylomirabilota bacterium]|nr:tRNA (guanosine(37)-N1)-methyltransferase TrmD [Methylomirabilota bacterium]
MRFSILTLNPGFFPGALDEGMIRVARQKGLLDVSVVAIRDFTDDRYGTTDDYPYGGGAGMVMKAEPILRANESVRREAGGGKPRALVTSPQGRVFTQSWARELALEGEIVVLCGRYKGIDERVIPLLGAEEISVGDYVLSGGEPAVVVILDAVARLIPGVLGDKESAEADSFSEPLLDAPVYTRPEDVEGRRVPDVLLSGDHERIRLWRRREAIRRTWLKRPDLLLGRTLCKEDQKLLDEIKEEEEQ